MRFIENLQDDHPTLWRVTVWSLPVAGLFALFLCLPANDFTRATGIAGLQARTVAAQRALYWSARSLLHKSAGHIAPTVLYGSLLGIDAQGRALVSVPEGDTYQQHAYDIADVSVTDVTGAAAFIAEHRFADVKLYLYGASHAVIWMGGRPLNLRLIEIGAAKADPSPPTNIVDSAFAAYYWRRAKHGTES